MEPESSRLPDKPGQNQPKPFQEPEEAEKLPLVVSIDKHTAAAQIAGLLQFLPPEEAAELLEKNLPADKMAAIFQGATVEMLEQHVEYSGPLPPGPMLARYNDAYDGAARDVVKMAQDEQRHYHKMQETAQRRANWDLALTAIQRFSGMGAAFWLTLQGLNYGFTLGMAGHELAAGALSAAGLAALAGVFMRNKETMTGRKPQPPAVPEAPTSEKR